MGREITITRSGQLAYTKAPPSQLVQSAIDDMTIAFPHSLPKATADKIRWRQLLVEAFDGADDSVIQVVLKAFIFERGREFAPAFGVIREACEKETARRQREDERAQCAGFTPWEWESAFRSWPGDGVLHMGRSYATADPFDPSFEIPALVEQRCPRAVASFREDLARAVKHREHLRRMAEDPAYRDGQRAIEVERDRQSRERLAQMKRERHEEALRRAERMRADREENNRRREALFGIPQYAVSSDLSSSQLVQNFMKYGD